MYSPSACRSAKAVKRGVKNEEKKQKPSDHAANQLKNGKIFSSSGKKMTKKLVEKSEKENYLVLPIHDVNVFSDATGLK